MISNSGSLVFVETTAIVLNAIGRPEVRDGIRQVTDAADLCSSQFVLSEFRAVLTGLYDRLRDRLLSNAEPDKSGSIGDLIREATDGLPHVVSGGYAQMADLCVRIGQHFGPRTVTARQVANWLQGEMIAVESSGLRFRQGDLRDCSNLIDNHTCCVFQTQSPCGDSPKADCRFEWVCGTGRDRFLDSVRVLANSRREESSWLSRNFALTNSASGRQLLKLVKAHVSQFGDIIIFWAVPEGAALLTRDNTFVILREASARAIDILKVRARRRRTNVAGLVTSTAADPNSTEVSVLNWTSRDCLVVAATALGKKGEEVRVQVDDLGISQRGTIMRLTQIPGAVEHGIRFKTQRTEA